MISDRSRIAAAGAVVCSVAGTGAVVYALGVLPEPWTRGYISEGGVAASPRDGVYRAGVLAVAASLALLGVALRRWVPFVGAILVTGSLFGVASAAVSCTPGCPLPPYEQSTPTDLVHAGASVLAVGSAVLAMAVLALISLHARLRRAARVFCAVTVPLMLLLVYGLLAVGRGQFTSVLERVALAPAVVWIAVTGLLALLRPPSSRPRPAADAGPAAGAAPVAGSRR